MANIGREYGEILLTPEKAPLVTDTLEDTPGTKLAGEFPDASGPAGALYVPAVLYGASGEGAVRDPSATIASGSG